MTVLGFVLTSLLLQTPTGVFSQLGSIQGRVTATSGNPIAKVTVTLLGPSATMQRPATALAQPGQTVLELTSDADGKFAFSGLKPGAYRLRANRDGFTAVEYGQKSPNGVGSLISLAAGQSLNGVALTLTQKGAITGRIVDSNGLPVVRATVSAYQFVYTRPGQARSLTSVATITTNELGEYRLYGLTPGNYFVAQSFDSVVAILRGTSVGTLISVEQRPAGASLIVRKPRSDGSFSEEVSVRTYFPGTVNAKDASPIVVRAGETVSGIDFNPRTVPAYRIRGTTIDEITGLPVSIPVQLSTSGSLDFVPLTRNSSDIDGFEFAGVPSGSYLLNNVPITVGDSDVTNVVLKRTSGLFNILGRIVLPAERSPSVISAQAQARITLSSNGQPNFSASSNLSGNASFSLSIPPGDYQVSIDITPGSYFLKSARLGTQDALDGLHISGPTEGMLELVLGSEKGVIDGRIVDSRRESVANVTVVLIPNPPLRQRTALYVNVPVDAAGHFHMSVTPGNYRIFAWEDVETGAWFDPDFIATNESRGRAVSVNEGSLQDSIEVVAIPYLP
jgi:protocatechuate 3,4-dioxygenase beta subunit